MKNKKIILLISLLIMPSLVIAEGRSDLTDLPIITAIFVEAFVSIHMSVFVLKPLAELIKPEDSKNYFWKLFGIRAVILLFFDFFITTYIAIIDFLMVFFL